MKLSLCIITVNSAAYIEKLMLAGKKFADEIVVAVDGYSADATETICGAYADKLFLLEPLGDFSKSLVWLNEQCDGDWILWLDQDELPSEKLVANLQRLMSDKEITHYWLRRRWLLSHDQERWISQHPWWPDWQLRLYRNIPSIMSYPGRIHTSFSVQGGSRYIYEGAIYHYDFAYHSVEQRRKKIELYERLAPTNKLEHFYLPDEHLLATEPVPKDDRPLQDIDRNSERVRPTRALARKISLSDLHHSPVQDIQYTPELFRAQLDCMRPAQEMSAGEWRLVDVRLRNDSVVAWCPPGQGVPAVRIGYHWLRADGEIHEYRGHRTNLPHVLRPGETVSLPASIRAPEEPGRYSLQWDLVIENVSWFSRQGWRGPQTKVRVLSESLYCPRG